MTRFYEPDLTVDANSPFVRDASHKLVRRAYWMDMTDPTLLMVMTKGIGANLTNEEKRAHLIDRKAGTLDRSGMRSGNFAAREIAVSVPEISTTTQTISVG